MQRSNAPNYIMDTGFPIVEPCAREYYTEYFERWPGLCCGDTHRETIIGRSISNIELLSWYSIPMEIISLSLDHSSFEDTLDDCLPHTVPWKIKYRVLSACITWCDILELHYLNSSCHADNFQCYITRSHKNTLNWKKAYSTDPSTSRMVSLL